MARSVKFVKWSPESGEAAIPICPRCDGGVPNSLTPGAYPGALSRWDNKTELCSDCGTEEAMIAFTQGRDALDPYLGVHRWTHQPTTGS